MSENDWYVKYDNIFTYTITHKLMTVCSNNGLFGPFDNITRGQVASILWRMAGEPVAQSESFSDVDYTNYYGPAIRWARAQGIISGYETYPGSNMYENFGPENDVTREQLAAMLANYANKVGGLSIISSNAKLDVMPDASEVSEWAQDSVAWAMNQGRPQQTAQRCAMAKMATVLDRDIL